MKKKCLSKNIHNCNSLQTGNGNDVNFNENVDIGNHNVPMYSKHFIVHNDRGLTVANMEYSALMIMCICLILSPLSLIHGEIGDEFVIFYSYNSNELDGSTIGYIIGVSILWFFDSYLFTYGMMKLHNASLSAILDTSDVFFTYVISYVWLGESPNVYATIGAVLVIVTIVISVYPWQRHERIPISF